MVGVIVHLPFLTRAVCLPILARLWIPGERDRTPLILARELLDLVTGHLGDRPVHLVGDAAYIGRRTTPATARPRHRDRLATQRRRPVHPTPTTHRPPGPPAGQRQPTPEPIVIAAMTRYQWTPIQICCYGKTLDRQVLAIPCL